jgi:hypothetical protein
MYRLQPVLIRHPTLPGVVRIIFGAVPVFQVPAPPPTRAVNPPFFFGTHPDHSVPMPCRHPDVAADRQATEGHPALLFAGYQEGGPGLTGVPMPRKQLHLAAVSGKAAEGMVPRAHRIRLAGDAGTGGTVHEPPRGSDTMTQTAA